MPEIVCAWAFHEDNKLNKLMKQNARLAKLVLLWRNHHLVDQYFISRVMEPWANDCKDYNELQNPDAALQVLKYALNEPWSQRYPDLNRFIFKWWPYFSPNLNWKINVNFTEGQIPSITI